MNGYLTNLLARSRGTADVMRPRIASLFEPVEPEPPMMPETQPTRAIQEREEDAPAVERRAITLDTPLQKPLERERPEAPAAIEQRVELEEKETRQNTVIAPSRVQVQEPTRAPEARPAETAPPQPNQPERKARPLPAAPPAREQVRVIEAAVMPPPSHPIAREQASLMSPARRPRFQPIPPVQKAVTTEPEVHVTIGRLEVRAVTEPTSPKKERAGSTVMSLTDYLKSRAGGGR